ncbi:hypothetical protein [Globicatella sanguinis]|uniref:hypothetical protein n=1 Tax=Globicatella sanguinis TaxID=13076 RepID=UPI00082481AF|nr:hypothetical protein [Globicatella sanguinis]
MKILAKMLTKILINALWAAALIMLLRGSLDLKSYILGIVTTFIEAVYRIWGLISEIDRIK